MALSWAHTPVLFLWHRQQIWFLYRRSKVADYIHQFLLSHFRVLCVVFHPISICLYWSSPLGVQSKCHSLLWIFLGIPRCQRMSDFLSSGLVSWRFGKCFGFGLISSLLNTDPKILTSGTSKRHFFEFTVMQYSLSFFNTIAKALLWRAVVSPTSI